MQGTSSTLQDNGYWPVAIGDYGCHQFKAILDFAASTSFPSRVISWFQGMTTRHLPSRTWLVPGHALQQQYKGSWRLATTDTCSWRALSTTALQQTLVPPVIVVDPPHAHTRQCHRHSWHESIRLLPTCIMIFGEDVENKYPLYQLVKLYNYIWRRWRDKYPLYKLIMIQLLARLHVLAVIAKYWPPCWTNKQTWLCMLFDTITNWCSRT